MVKVVLWRPSVLKHYFCGDRAAILKNKSKSNFITLVWMFGGLAGEFERKRNSDIAFC